MDPRQRRASDGVLCAVKETSSVIALSRGHRSPLLSYKTEPGAGKSYFTNAIFSSNKQNTKFVNTSPPTFSFFQIILLLM